MSQENDLWARQFVEGIKEIARAYDRFCITREIEDFDRAYLLHGRCLWSYLQEKALKS